MYGELFFLVHRPSLGQTWKHQHQEQKELRTIRSNSTKTCGEIWLTGSLRWGPPCLGIAPADSSHASLSHCPAPHFYHCTRHGLAPTFRPFPLLYFLWFGRMLITYSYLWKCLVCATRLHAIVGLCSCSAYMKNKLHNDDKYGPVSKANIPWISKHVGCCICGLSFPEPRHKIWFHFSQG